jgi:hypothetical protein
VLCFFNGHCWPVMATHDLPGRDDGGCQFCDWSVELRTAGCSWIGARDQNWLDVVVWTTASRDDTFERPRRRMLRQIIGRAVLAPSSPNCQPPRSRK